MHSEIVKALSDWLQEVVEDSTEVLTITPLSGDAGGRCYFSIAGHPELLAVYNAPGHENIEHFQMLANFLLDQGIHAPRVFATDLEQGFSLIENLGERLYLSDLNEGSVEALYGEALLTLLRIQQSPRSAVEIEDYSREKLNQEMELFTQWFVGDLLSYKTSNEEDKLIQHTFDTLIDSALEQDQCFVHRDYHSRNLIHRELGPPGVIDFQDAVWGPVTYDVVSLLRDCYIRWPRESVERWALAYADMARQSGIIADVSQKQFLRWFDLMGLQRHLKVLGIFARLHLRDNKAAYLQDLPLVMRYTLEIADSYPELKTFDLWFKEKLIPLAEQQTWYVDYEKAGYAPGEFNQIA
ncbi:phosphotransferase [Aurantivibrio infirmus]